MRRSMRAVVGLALLCGCYLIPLAIIGALLAIDVVAVVQARLTAIKLMILTAPVVFALLRALISVTRSRGDTDIGVAVTAADQPRLIGMVHALAAQVGTRPPAEVRLVLDANAAVAERTRMLGLRAGFRRMYIGVPLLAGLTEPQLLAVLAHELGHYSHRDTWFAAATYRGRLAVLGSIARLDGKQFFQRVLRAVFVRYTKLYLRVTLEVCRRQELAADAMAARAAGAAATVAALRAIPALEMAWEVFIERYATLGWRAGFLPARIGAGFRALLADPAWRDQLDADRPEDQPSPYDTHPPVGFRIAAVENLHRSPFPEPTRVDRPAMSQLVDPEALFQRVVRTTVEGAGGLRTADWPELAHLAGRTAAIESIEQFLDGAARVSGRAGSLGTILDLLDADAVEELGTPLSERPTAAGRRVLREMARTAVQRNLVTLVIVALADAGKARWTLSWSAPPALTVDEPYAGRLTDMVSAAIADHGDTAGLRALLAAAGVDLVQRPTTRPSTRTRFTAQRTGVQHHGVQ